MPIKNGSNNTNRFCAGNIAEKFMEKLNEFLDSYKLPLALTFVGLVLIVGGIISSRYSNSPKVYPKAENFGQGTKVGEIKIDVSGAVTTPGVYTLDSNSRLEDAIKAAGGFSEDVNTDAVARLVNLSQKLTDGAKVYIPALNDKLPSVAGKIGINSASQSELESMPGVGPVTAGNILNNRPYSSVEELLTKKLVSKSVYDKIKDLVDTN